MGGLPVASGIEPGVKWASANVARECLRVKNNERCGVCCFLIPPRAETAEVGRKR